MKTTADLCRTVAAFFAAVLLSATCVVGAVGPARAEVPSAGATSNLQGGSSKADVHDIVPILM